MQFHVVLVALAIVSRDRFLFFRSFRVEISAFLFRLEGTALLSGFHISFLSQIHVRLLLISIGSHVFGVLDHGHELLFASVHHEDGSLVGTYRGSNPKQGSNQVTWNPIDAKLF